MPSAQSAANWSMVRSCIAAVHSGLSGSASWNWMKAASALCCDESAPWYTRQSIPARSSRSG